MQNPQDRRVSDTTAAGSVQLNKKTARFAGDHNCVEITLDVGDDGEAMQSVVTSTTNSAAAAAAARTADGREEKISSLSTAVKGSSRIREVSRELKRLDRSKPVTAPALAGLKFIAKSGSAADAWARMEGNFDNLTLKTNGLLHRSRFGQCIGMNEKPKNVKPKKDDLDDDEKSKNDFACELFDALCRRMHIGTGDSITKAELKQICDVISDPSFDSRLQIFLDMVDKDGDGRIVEHEIKEIIVVSASANKLSNIGNAEAEEYARLIMEELDPDNCGYIRIENLSTLLFQQGQIHTSTETSGNNNRELSKMLSQKLKPTRDHPLKRYHSKFHHLMTDYWKRVWLLASWVGIMISLFAYKYAQYKNKRDVFRVMGNCVCTAKGAAEILKLNMALILLPVCRNTITWLRNKTTLGVAVPFDDNINFHQMIAVAIAIGVGIHGISHLACDFPRLLSATPEEYKPMERYFGDQPKSYGHFLKGWEGVTGILMVVLMAFAFTLASPWFRRTNNLLIRLPENKKLEKPIVFINGLLKKLTGFNAFWYSHHLFVVVYTLLIVHGIKLYLTHEWYKKTTWMYLSVPVVLYAGERLVRAFRSSVKAVKILKAVVYRGDVLTLQMSKPLGFDYRSGQYIFVNCAAVSPFEWHPFSITSAPMDDYVSVHIRRNGDWTGKIISIFKDVCKPPTTGERGILIEECLPGENINPKLPEVLIDGPYGSSTQEYKDYDVVLLIGLGIGATPMISVVKDIVHNIKAKEEEENSLEECSRNHVSVEQELKTRKAYFYWQTREQGSFDWFKGVMNEVGEMDNSKGLIEMHNYCTSVHEEGDARSALITMLQSINRAKNGVDVVSGTKVMTHFGRPKWRDVFKGIALNHPGARVGVFYCGPAPPVKELRQLASDFSHKISTKFEFHKENF